MKHRTTKNGTNFLGKIKTEHSIIEGLYDLLEDLASWPEINSIIPGRIMRRGSSQPNPTIAITIPTQTGWKAVGKSKGSVQDFFIITDTPDVVAQKIKALN